jgi:hypothetical protein
VRAGHGKCGAVGKEELAEPRERGSRGEGGKTHGKVDRGGKVGARTLRRRRAPPTRRRRRWSGCGGGRRVLGLLTGAYRFFRVRGHVGPVGMDAGCNMRV